MTNKPCKLLRTRVHHRCASMSSSSSCSGTTSARVCPPTLAAMRARRRLSSASLAYTGRSGSGSSAVLSRIPTSRPAGALKGEGGSCTEFKDDWQLSSAVVHLRQLGSEGGMEGAL